MSGDGTGGRIERELQDLRARYQAMVDDAPEAIVVFDMDRGHYVEVNRRACELHGMSREALLATGPLAMSPKVQPNGVPSSVGVKMYLDSAMRGGHPQFEWTHLRADGALVPCRIQLTRVRTSEPGVALVRASIVDITQQRATERMRDRLSTIVDATTDIIGVADAQGRTQFINRAGRALLGIDPDENLFGTHIAEYHPPDVARLIVEEGIPHALTHDLWRGETAFITRSGERIPASQVIMAHKDDRGDVEFLSTVARDMRDRLAAEELERRVLHAQKLESLGVLAGGIAHDFNNILVGVLTNASVLASKLPPDSDAQRTVAEIVAAGRRASELAQQMLAYAGQARLEVEDIDLSSMLTEISQLVSASISKRATFITEFAADLPRVKGDPTQIRQVLMNLVINASEALGEGDGQIHVVTRTGHVTRETMQYCHLSEDVLGGPCVIAEVRDTGTGIGEADLQRIFDPFFTTKFTGRGLGLSAVLGIMRVHEGGISVHSSNRGTTFTLVFAAAGDSDGSGGEEPAQDTDHETPTDTFTPTGALLIADDEAAVRSVVRVIGEDLGYDIVEADNGTDALAKALDPSTGISAAVLDLTMPGLTGLEVLLKLHEQRPDVPVVLTSGYPRSGLSDLGAHVKFLRKPFTLEDLEQAIQDAVRGV